MCVIETSKRHLLWHKKKNKRTICLCLSCLHVHRHVAAMASWSSWSCCRLRLMLHSFDWTHLSALLASSFSCDQQSSFFCVLFFFTALHCLLPSSFISQSWVLALNEASILNAPQHWPFAVPTGKVVICLLAKTERQQKTLIIVELCKRKGGKGRRNVDKCRQAHRATWNLNRIEVVEKQVKTLAAAMTTEILFSVWQ